MNKLDDPRTTDFAISVCIATWNQALFIRETVLSAMNQRGVTVTEVLVGDDCSTDGTGEIVAELAAAHPGLVRYIRHGHQLGASANFQALIRLAKGNFIAHLDGDDCWRANKLAKQLTFLAEHPACVAVYSNAAAITANGMRIGLFNNAPTGIIELRALLARGNYLNMSSILYRAELRDDLLAIEEPFIDYRAHLRLLRHGPVGHIAEPLVVYRVGSPGSMMVHDKPNVRRMYWEAIMDVPRDLVSDHDFALGVADFYRRVLFHTVRTRRLGLAREWWPHVRAASPYGALRTGWLVGQAVAGSAFKELAGLFNTGSSGPRPKVLYRR